MRFSLVSCTLLTFLLGVPSARADSVTFSYSIVPVPPIEAETENGTPRNHLLHQFRVTTDGDILSVNNIQITLLGNAALYQHPFGSNANPPNPGVVAAFPLLAFDTYIDTPGVGTLLGPDLPGDGTTTVGDTTNDGPQTNFLFAQLTLPNTLFGGRFTGRVSIQSSTLPFGFNQPFSFILFPEPSSAVLAVAAVPVALVARARGMASAVRSRGHGKRRPCTFTRT